MGVDYFLGPPSQGYHLFPYDRISGDKIGINHLENRFCFFFLLVILKSLVNRFTSFSVVFRFFRTCLQKARPVSRFPCFQSSNHDPRSWFWHQIFSSSESTGSLIKPGWFVLIGQVKQYFAYETQHQHVAFAMTGGFKYFLFSPRTLGKIPILTSIFLRWVETTN